jgi:transcriptional regulator with XRE-family HTH domain
MDNCQAQSSTYNKIGFYNRFLTMKSKLRHVLATNMKNRRNLLGLSQAKLAEIANIATGYVAMIELEKKFPSDEVLERIAYALKIDPTELFSKTSYPVEAVRTLHQSVLEGFDQVVKAQITKFEAKYRG